MFGRRRGLSRSDIEDALSDHAEEIPEEKTADIWEELDRRKEYCGEGYPFECGIGRMTRRGKWIDFVPYAFQLSIACARHYSVWTDGPVRTDTEEVYPERVFGHAVVLALESYLDGRAIRFDSPRSLPVPGPYDEAVGFVAREICEDLGRVPSYRDDPKDEHLDVVAWVPFSDSRAGKLIVLAQCATGSRWMDKITELDVHAWAKYVDWPRDPLKAFAIPFVVPEADDDSDMWRYVSVHAGILLDRLRLTSCLTRRSRQGGTYSPVAEVDEQMSHVVPALVSRLPELA